MDWTTFVWPTTVGLGGRLGKVGSGVLGTSGLEIGKGGVVTGGAGAFASWRASKPFPGRRQDGDDQEKRLVDLAWPGKERM